MESFFQVEVKKAEPKKTSFTLLPGDRVMKYEIRQNAYLKLVLHALKHTASPVNGILIGRSTADGDMVEIRDAVPLFHSNQIGLLPSLEIALMQIEEYYESQGLSLVGYFHANERFDDYELSNVAKNIGEHIYRYFPQAAVLLLDNRNLDALSKMKDRKPVMQLYTREASRNWKLVGSDGSTELAIKEPTAKHRTLRSYSIKKVGGHCGF